VTAAVSRQRSNTSASHCTFAHSYRLFINQAEYCTNLIFDERVALDRMTERLLDFNRSIGRPDKLSTIFRYRITKAYTGGLKTQIADHHLGNPVIRSEYKQGSIKQYVRDDRLLRTEATSNKTPDLGVPKSIQHVPHLRRVLRGINDRYLAIQQDVLETYVDPRQLARLRQPTITPSGRRTPGLKLDDPRLLAVMQALTHFTHIARGGRFRTRDLHQIAADTLGLTTATYCLRNCATTSPSCGPRDWCSNCRVPKRTVSQLKASACAFCSSSSFSASMPRSRPQHLTPLLTT
jgi:hypothetical protein